MGMPVWTPRAERERLFVVGHRHGARMRRAAGAGASLAILAPARAPRMAS